MLGWEKREEMNSGGSTQPEAWGSRERGQSLPISSSRFLFP